MPETTEVQTFAAYLNQLIHDHQGCLTLTALQYYHAETGWHKSPKNKGKLGLITWLDECRRIQYIGSDKKPDIKAIWKPKEALQIVCAIQHHKLLALGSLDGRFLVINPMKV